MANFSTNIARNDLARAWIFEDGFMNCNNDPKYVPCISFDALTQDAGDRTRIECPDPYRLGSFVEVGTIPGEISRLTTTLTGRMTRDSLSDFRRYFNQQCSLDIQLVYGLCERPNIYGEFDKILVFEEVFITSYGSDALSALSSADRAEINETVDISVGNFYEIVNLTYNLQGVVNAATLGPIIDGVVVDIQSCGVDCNDSSDGCEKLFVTDAAGDLLYTVDAGQNWETTTTSFAGGGGVVTGIDFLRNWVWSYNNVGEIAYLTPSGIRDNSVNKLVTGLSTAGLDQDAGFEFGLVVGTAGFIGYLTNPALGFDSIPDAITTEDLLDVTIGLYAENRDCVLVGGGNGTVLFSDDGLNWIQAEEAPTADPIVAVYPKDADSWLVASDTEVFCTDACGATNSWTPVTLPCAVTAIHDIQRGASRAVYWLTATDQGTGDEILLRSTDGGNTWQIQTSGGNKGTPISGVPGENTLIPCVTDPNQITVVGDTGGAGSILFGSP